MVYISKRICIKNYNSVQTFNARALGSLFALQQDKLLILHGPDEYGDHGWSISQAKQHRHFPHAVVSPKKRPCAAWHDAARGHARETIYDAVTPAEGVIYSLICCGNGQRIITCKILINVLQQQTSFAKLVICRSAPDSEQLN